MPFDKIIRLAEEHDRRPRRLAAETKLAHLAEVKAMGRHTCRIELDGGNVKMATYDFAD